MVFSLAQPDVHTAGLGSGPHVRNAAGPPEGKTAVCALDGRASARRHPSHCGVRPLQQRGGAHPHCCTASRAETVPLDGHTRATRNSAQGGMSRDPLTWVDADAAHRHTSPNQMFIAVSFPTCRFVPIKLPTVDSRLMLTRTKSRSLVSTPLSFRNSEMLSRRLRWTIL